MMSPVVLGVDLGTTTITALAWDPLRRDVLATCTLANDAQVTGSADKALGRSEWDARAIVGQACRCLRTVTERLGSRAKDIAGVGITGQQHGVMLVDAGLRPITPLVNWQDQRGEERYPGTSRTLVEQAVFLAGEEASRKTGCRLATGFLGITLFWWKAHGVLPAAGTACFLGDYLASTLTGEPPVTDPTNAASSGVFDIERRVWDAGMLAALGLPCSWFPEVREATQRQGVMISAMASATGVPAGVPVFVAMGDSQAAFLGSVEDARNSVLVNIGTGAQVAAAVDRFHYVPSLETRPLPGGRYLLVGAVPCGGQSYALLENFFRATLRQLGNVEDGQKFYERMNCLADTVPPGADGLRCRPTFAGTRDEPSVRASWTGMASENFTPAHLVRALLEGVAEVLYENYERIGRAAEKPFSRITGAGNGLRLNPALRRILAERLGMPLDLAKHEEEAALGVARVAARGAGMTDGSDGLL